MDVAKKAELCDCVCLSTQIGEIQDTGFSSAISSTAMTLHTIGYQRDLEARENLCRVASKLPTELTYQ